MLALPSGDGTADTQCCVELITYLVLVVEFLFLSLVE